MSVSDRIIKIREEQNLSQTDLARRAGLKPPAISQYESGVRNPSYEALIKLSNALGVSTDYLISGREDKYDSTNDKVIRLLLKIAPNLSLENKDKLLEYAIFLADSTNISEIPLLNEADYADFILKKYSVSELPINVMDIANKLGVDIFTSDLNDGEGVLINGNKKLIILSRKESNKQRQKFTIATLLGHAVIPWHVQSNYTIRKSGTSTLLTDSIQEMEAQDFACRLIMPQAQIIKDFSRTKATIENLKKLASDKYDVSLFALMNHLVKIESDSYAVVQSSQSSIIKTYPGNRPIVENLSNQSYAATFFSNPPTAEEIRQGSIASKYWLQDAYENEMIYEESIYNPEYNSALTLLKFGK